MALTVLLAKTITFLEIAGALYGVIIDIFFFIDFIILR
jgi:hypothetical protein